MSDTDTTHAICTATDMEEEVQVLERKLFLRKSQLMLQRRDVTFWTGTSGKRIFLFLYTVQIVLIYSDIRDVTEPLLSAKMAARLSKSSRTIEIFCFQSP